MAADRCARGSQPCVRLHTAWRACARRNQPLRGAASPTCARACLRALYSSTTHHSRVAATLGPLGATLEIRLQSAERAWRQRRDACTGGDGTPPPRECAADLNLFLVVMNFVPTRQTRNAHVLSAYHRSRGSATSALHGRFLLPNQAVALPSYLPQRKGQEDQTRPFLWDGVEVWSGLIPSVL
jgi:hypothetical protein